jgi:hypothetical protein
VGSKTDNGEKTEADGSSSPPPFREGGPGGVGLTDVRQPAAANGSVAVGISTTTVRVRARFLHLIQRTAGEQMWQEAEDREVALPETPVKQLETQLARQDFSFPARLVRDSRIIREQLAIQGTVEITAVRIHDTLYRLMVRVSNVTPPTRADGSREDLLPVALVSTHVILESTHGAFVSQIDPPEQHRAVAEACQNVGVWPVLVGEPGEHHTILASPIILYDHPQIAPESPGDLFDATEIDEILTLRILTMTDDEKREMRAADPRADALLARTEALAREELMRLHGTIRGLRPVGG